MQRRLWEAASSSVSEKKSPVFYGTKGSLPCSQQPIPQIIGTVNKITTFSF